MSAVLVARRMWDPEGTRIATHTRDDLAMLYIDAGRTSTTLTLSLADLAALHARIGAALAPKVPA